ncbi:hypothetical protein GCM10011415_13310 [Salipiger pallidus]|uniref:Uncharacterized protein n=1 Tax=Salipiger pallidus TaxID=1775170 RepID=A0A8J2ZI53_9RHOB|nr:hypothetical protein GCM10011415_13310 [Salipiger pallidus]
MIASLLYQGASCGQKTVFAQPAVRRSLGHIVLAAFKDIFAQHGALALCEKCRKLGFSRLELPHRMYSAVMDTRHARICTVAGSTAGRVANGSNSGGGNV